jgi:acetyltransferase
VIDPDGESRELAIVVSDEMQHQGTGSLVMKGLMDAARDHRLAAMEGAVLADNTGMLELMRSLGYSIRRDRQQDGPHLVERWLWRRVAEIRDETRVNGPVG